MIRRPPRSTPLYSSAASDVYKRQDPVSKGALSAKNHRSAAPCPFPGHRISCFYNGSPRREATYSVAREGARCRRPVVFGRQCSLADRILLSGAQVGFDQLNRPKVDMQFQGQGGDEFANITQEMAQKAQVTGQDQLLVIVLDGTVQSAPRVNERIGGGRAEITGDFTLQESKQLALVLQTGALPIELEV